MEQSRLTSAPLFFEHLKSITAAIRVAAVIVADQDTHPKIMDYNGFDASAARPVKKIAT